MVGSYIIRSATTLKHLAVVTDEQISFQHYDLYAAYEAVGIQSPAAHIRPIIREPITAVRNAIAYTIVLYANPVWSAALIVKATYKKMANVYCLNALRQV